MDQLMQSLPMFLMMIGVVYFLIIRPQNKKMKEHRELIESLKRGDEVVTQGGLIGKITKVADEEVTVELGDGVKVRVVKFTIGEVRNRPEPKPANDSKK
jgi:preprotein translocase subunit YajC